ncbi:MAG: hypothetical protein JNL87_00465 [Burkholderiaceae bacterium]|nr:hypothetical protein [Burkholderiaceae bacterium]
MRPRALRAVLLALLAAGAIAAPSGGVRTPVPAVEPALQGPCIADPATMRRQHPDMLRHQRDETVHQGIRGAKASLQGCIRCHASKTTGSVAAAKTDFCVACHSYAAVKVDCFECHASRPKGLAANHGAARP